ncbi:MAG: transglutaminase family protein [Rhodospirillaceae bacterium]
MRLLTVRHVSIYRYASPVSLGEHWMMFRPRESHDLRLTGSTLAIHPEPRSLRWLHDVFDNSLAVATFAGETTELRFESAVTLEHYESDRPDYRLALEAQFYPFTYAPEDRANLEKAMQRRYPSEDVTAWARSFVSATAYIDTMVLLTAMTLATRDAFAYRRRFERGTQTPTETLSLGTGSCRDFALFLMEAVRSLGLAARFVSGYIFIPEDGPDGSVGGGATHAWIQVYLPGAGWVDFDPTNSIIGNRNLIRVAVALDPADVPPLWGTFTGAVGSFMGLEVNVSVVDETASHIRPLHHIQRI